MMDITRTFSGRVLVNHDGTDVSEPNCDNWTLSPFDGVHRIESARETATVGHPCMWINYEFNACADFDHENHCWNQFEIDYSSLGITEVTIQLHGALGKDNSHETFATFTIKDEIEGSPARDKQMKFYSRLEAELSNMLETMNANGNHDKMYFDHVWDNLTPEELLTE